MRVEGYIYVALSPSGLVKIGHSINPERRVAALRCPLGERPVLLFYFEAPLQRERVLHDHLRERYGVAGEWYPDTVRELMRAVQAALHDEAADRMHAALKDIIRSLHSQLVEDLTELAVNAWEGRGLVDPERAAERFSVRGSETADAINARLDSVLAPAKLIVDTVRFADLDLAEEALSQ